MTNPPNRVGGIRGPNGATLDDVVEALASIAGSLVLVQADTAAIRSMLSTVAPATPNVLSTLLTRVSYLTGSATPSNGFGQLGLPNYLRLVAGDVRLAGTEGFPPMQDLLSNVDRWTFDTVKSLHGLNVGSQGANQLVEAASTLVALLTALGSFTSPPADTTIKSILQAQLECCEDSGATYNPAAPTSGCSGAAPAWQECALVLSAANVGGEDIYRVVFPAIVFGTIASLGNAQIGSVDKNALIDLSEEPWNANTEVCMAWDFAPTVVTTNFDIVVTNDINGYGPFASYVSGDNPGNQGSQLNILPAGGFGGTVRGGLFANFAFAAGTQLQGKVWVMASDSTFS